MPDIRLRLLEEELSARGRTNKPVLHIQVDVYGAPRGTEILFKGPNGGNPPVSCVEQSIEANGERRHLLCLPQAQEEGSQRLEVVGYGANGNTMEPFSWFYDTTPPKALINYEKRADWRGWGRDDAFYVQLEAKEGSEDIDWGKSALLYDDSRRRAAHVKCPSGFSTEANTQCFEVLLSALPDLPHGPYELRLETHLVDGAGNEEKLNTRDWINIDRVSWREPEKPGVASNHRLIVTREGWVIVQSGAGKISALDAKTGKMQWSHTLEHGNSVDFILLGNHKGTQLLVKTCNTDNGMVGLRVLSPQTGDASACLEPNMSTKSMAVLQGGSNQDLVVVRSIGNGISQLQTCQLTGNGHPSQMRFHCNSDSVSFSLAEDTAMLVQPRETDTAVLFSSNEDVWVSAFWGQGKWNGFKRSDAGLAGLMFGIGTDYVWGENWVSPIGSPKDIVRFSMNTTPLAIDTGDQLIAFGGGELHRYNSRWESLVQLPMDSPQEGFLLKDGSILLAGQNFVTVLGPQFARRWQIDAENSDIFDAGFELKQATLAPHPGNAERSVLVLEMEKDGKVIYHGILIDSPGLKNAPWPTRGGDVCQSSNADVSHDNCWGGIRSPLIG